MTARRCRSSSTCTSWGSRAAIARRYARVATPGSPARPCAGRAWLRLDPCQGWEAGRGAEFMPSKEAPSAHARSEEHTSELQSLMRISYAVFCLKKKQELALSLVQIYI